MNDGTWDEQELVTVLGSHVPGVLHFKCLPCWSRGSCHQCSSINVNGLVYDAVFFFMIFINVAGVTILRLQGRAKDSDKEYSCDSRVSVSKNANGFLLIM